MIITSRQIEEIALCLADRNTNENVELKIIEIGNGAIKVDNLLGIDYYFNKEGEPLEGDIL